MITFIIVMIIIAVAAQRYILAYSLTDLYYDNWPSSPVVEPEETFEIVVRLQNKKWMPELYLQVTQNIPKEAGFKGNRINKRFYMLPHRQLTSRTPLSLPERGRYIFRGAKITGGDFFGFDARDRQYDTIREVVVLPKQTESPALDRVLSGFLGDLSVNRFIMPDPVLTIGIREYTGREPMKDIHWPHSARTGQMMVKQYDHTVELAVTVILNLEAPKKTPNEIKEHCFSLTRKICEELNHKGITYGFQTNGVAAGNIGMLNRIGDGHGARHLSIILEGLGRGTYEWRDNFNLLAERVMRKSDQGRAYIVVTPVKTPEHTKILERLYTRSGLRALVIEAENLCGE
jgi:hypothetical protein